jgi:hypothetical protein
MNLNWDWLQWEEDLSYKIVVIYRHEIKVVTDPGEITLWERICDA